MLVLLFYLGDTLYTMKCDRIREIAPMVRLKPVPHSPDYMAGLFNYRGSVVPVIDLRRLIQGTPCEMRLSTRIILVEYPGKDGTSILLGLMAERITETARKPDHALVSPGLRLEEAPYLGGLIMENRQMIQYIDLDLLPDAFRFLPMLEQGNHEPEPH